jgi:RNA polymerase sigma-70 factor (ECF subfamily)
MSDANTTPGEPFEKYREYLDLLARQQVRQRLQGKIDLSGVVQQTLLEAHQAIAILEPLADAQQAVWLRRALANNLADELRKLATGKRDARREQALQAGLDQSASRFEALLPADSVTPSRNVEQAEQFLQMAAAIKHLPDAQRQAIELHHLQGLPLAEVAAEMGSTAPAVAGLLHRGLKKVRELMADG